MATYHLSMKIGSKGNSASGIAKYDYISRAGKYAAKGDLEYIAYGNMPSWANDPRNFWKAADENERANGRVYREIEVALPREISADERRLLVKGFIAEHLDGHAYSVAIHCPKAALDGEDQPHAHIIFSERRAVEQPAELYFSRKGAKKDDSWKAKDKLVMLRESWEKHYNQAVIFDEVKVSCKSLKDQGITDRQPERHLGHRGVRSAGGQRVKQMRRDRRRKFQIDQELEQIEKQLQDVVVQQKPAKPEPPPIPKTAPSINQSVTPKAVHGQVEDPRHVPGAAPTTTSRPSVPVPPAQSEALPQKPLEPKAPIPQPAVKPVSAPPVQGRPESVPPTQAKPADWYLKCLEHLRDLVYKWRGAVRWNDLAEKDRLEAEIKKTLVDAGHKKIDPGENSGAMMYVDSRPIIDLITAEKKRLGLGQQTQGIKR